MDSLKSIPSPVYVSFYFYILALQMFACFPAVTITEGPICKAKLSHHDLSGEA